MNADQQIDIHRKVMELKGSRACVIFHYDSSLDLPYIVVHKTGTGYVISAICNCKRVQSCVRFYDYNAIIKVLNKIIKQAKNN